MHIIDFHIDFTRINDEKAVSRISLKKDILSFLCLCKNHWFGNFLNLLIFESGEELMLRKVFWGKFDLLFLKFIPQDGNIFWNLISDRGRFSSGVDEFGFTIS